MKKFLITIAAGYLFMVAAVYITARMGQKPAALPSEEQAAGDASAGPAEVPKKALTKTPDIKPVAAVRAPRDFKTYYKNGTPSSSWSFEGESPEGTAFLYHGNGQLAAEIPWQGGRIHGVVRFYDELGNRRMELGWKEGVLQGESLEYYENGALRTRIFFEQGKALSPPDLYSEDGTHESAQAGLMLSPGAQAGAFRVLSPGSAARAEWQEGPEGSLLRVRPSFLSGHVSAEWFLSGGLPHGVVRSLSSEDYVYREDSFENGFLSGLVRLFYPDGSLQAGVPFMQGIPEGSAVLRYSDGSLWLEFLFENGRVIKMPRIYSEGQGAAPPAA